MWQRSFNQDCFFQRKWERGKNKVTFLLIHARTLTSWTQTAFLCRSHTKKQTRPRHPTSFCFIFLAILPSVYSFNPSLLFSSTYIHTHTHAYTYFEGFRNIKSQLVFIVRISLWLAEREKGQFHLCVEEFYFFPLSRTYVLHTFIEPVAFFSAVCYFIIISYTK